MGSIENLIREIKYDFFPYNFELLEREKELWQIFKQALLEQRNSSVSVQATVQEAQSFFHTLISSHNPKQDLNNIILDYVRTKKNIFVFFDEEELFLACLSEYISKVLPFNKRIGLLSTLFKLKKLIEDIAWQRETSFVYPTRVVTSDFFIPIQHMVDELLQEMFSWVNPLMVCFFAPDQRGEMHALSVIGQDKNIFANISIRTSISTKWGRGPISSVFRSRKPTFVYNQQDSRVQPYLNFWKQQNIHSALLLPIVRGHFNFGVMAIAFPNKLSENADIKNRLSPFIEKFTDCLVMNYKENHETVYCSLLTDSYTESLQAIVSILEKKDAYTAFHSQLVTQFAHIIGQSLDLPEQEMNILHDGSILHDIGKVGILDHILLKPSRLTKDEWESMMSHPHLGHQIVSQLNIHHDMSDIVLYHHERWDGKGYPYGLKNEEIPFLARIVSVADALEAITSHRPYRVGRTFESAREDIARCSGTQFDPLIVEKFLEIPADYFPINKKTVCKK